MTWKCVLWNDARAKKLRLFPQKEEKNFYSEFEMGDEENGIERKAKCDL